MGPADAPAAAPPRAPPPLLVLQNWLGVTLGGVVGHSLCTGLAVIGGRLLASRSESRPRWALGAQARPSCAPLSPLAVSERTVAWVGGILFFAFAAHSIYVGPEVDE